MNPPKRTFGPAGSDWAVLAILLGCLLALFWKFVLTSEMPFYRDVSASSYPLARFIKELCRRGELPYWNPYVYFGHPLLANPQNLFFYPTTLLIVFLPIDWAFKMHYVAHFALMAAGAYTLARRWEQSLLAACFSALIFLLSGPVLSLGNFYNHVACVAWLPWALLLTDTAVERSGHRLWILLTFVLSLQFLAGEPLTFLATFGLCVVLALHGALRGVADTGGTPVPLVARPSWPWPSRLPYSAWFRLLGRFAWVGLLLLGLSAAQLLPSFSLLSFSRRGQGLPFQEVIEWSLHPLSLLELVLPEFFGPLLETGSEWKAVLDWRLGSYFISIFVGAVPLFFALAGWTLGHNSRRRFVWGSSLVLLLLALGGFAPFFAVAYLLFPPLGMVRYPVKMLVPVVLLIALSAGWGLDALRASPGEWASRRRRLLEPLVVFVIATAVFWAVAWIVPALITYPAEWIFHRTYEIISWPALPAVTPEQVVEASQALITRLRLMLPGLAGYGLAGLCLVAGLGARRHWASAGLMVFAALGLVQLALVNSRVNPTVPQSFYTYRPPVLSFFANSEESYRFYCGWRPSFFYLGSIPQAAGLPLSAELAFRDKLLLLRGAMQAGVETAGAVDIDGSAPEAYYEFSLFHRRTELENKPQADCLLGRANVLYELDRPQSGNGVLRPVSEIFNGSPQPSVLYENLCALPRAFVVGKVLPAPSDREVLLRLASPDFPASQEVFISGNVPAPQTGEAPGNPGRVEITDRQPNQVTLRAELERPGYVVLLDRFDPNWHATLDGGEASIFRANLLFRAVHVPAGRHEVRFTYRQRGLKAGIALSVLTLLYLAVSFVVGR